MNPRLLRWLHWGQLSSLDYNERLNEKLNNNVVLLRDHHTTLEIV